MPGHTADQPFEGARPPSMPAIAMYHSVSPYEQDPYLVTVSPARFEQQMHWLRRRGLRGVSVSELLAARERGRARRLVGLTFDDGYAELAAGLGVSGRDQAGLGVSGLRVSGLRVSGLGPGGGAQCRGGDHRHAGEYARQLAPPPPPRPFPLAHDPPSVGRLQSSARRWPASDLTTGARDVARLTGGGRYAVRLIPSLSSHHPGHVRHVPFVRWHKTGKTFP